MNFKSIVKMKLFLLGMVGSFVLSGCTTSQKITILTYVPPNQVDNLAKLKSGSDLDSLEGSYLSLGLNPEIKFSDKKPVPEKMSLALIREIQSALSETNLIAIYPDYRTAPVSVDLVIEDYQYEKKDNRVMARLGVRFYISKGLTSVFDKKYVSEKRRSSKDAANLPSESKMIEALSRHVASKFVSDISPRKTFQVRIFKSFPEGLDYLVEMIKQGDFQTAIQKLQAYKGKKTADYYYNLAVLFEAEAANTENLVLSDLAAKNYELAIEKGGSNDKVIVTAYSRFNNFYKLLKLTQKQREQNKELMKKINEMYDISE